MKTAVRIACSLGALLLCGATAHAHGDLAATVPPKGSTLKKPVGHMAITFTQAPTKDSRIAVIDGCHRDVVDRVEFQDRVAHIYLNNPQPGKWKVNYSIVSDVDGHPTHGGYGLTVSGKPECANPEPDKDNGDKGDENGGPNAAGDDGPIPEDDGSSFPVVPVAIGAVALVGLAFIVRRASQ